ncbi:hypothetical protein HYV88_03720 [Candidatus Woesearchaeota archaeon]|nr:hypothetical protein [Candidatus Woesearchaeota archaeon]
MKDQKEKPIREKSTKVLDSLLHKLGELPYIQSVTLIGKRPDQGRGIERVNDMDIVVIANGIEGQLTIVQYETLQKILENIKNYQNGETDVLYAIADGPMKPKTELPNEVFIHFLLHTPETYRASPLTLVQNSWQYEAPLFGRSLHEFKRIPGVNQTMLIDHPLGITSLQEMVRTNSSAFLGWEQNEKGLMEIKLFPLQIKDLEEKLELYLYATLRGASNTLRYLTNDNTTGIDQSMTQKFEQAFSDSKYSSYPLESWQVKRDLRSRRLVLGQTYVTNRQIQTLGFLKFLEEVVRSHKKS